MTPRPAVWAIEAGTPFVDALAAGLMQRHGGEALALSRVSVLLPTRRACRALREAFVRLGGGRPMLLPAMRPLGDVDEDELALHGADVLDLPPAVTPLRRQLLLTRLIRRRAGLDDPAQAARLAAELARLLDEVETEQLDFAALERLVPQDFAEHWQITLDFLRIVTAYWPEVLAGEGALDPAVHRNRLLAALAGRWRREPPGHPVYAAGSTGSIPASAALLQVVAEMPHGALVLPGLDRELDDGSWAAALEEPTHPQHGLAVLLRRLGIHRAEVRPWPADGVAGAAAARNALIREVMRPAATSDAWATAPPAASEALAGLVRIDAPGLQEEAGAIALLMRRTLETPGRTAALVTPDRGLARRVAAALGRWNIAIDDSAGIPLAQTPPGVFLRLLARMLAEDAAPVPLLAALKHPLAAGGQHPATFRRRVRRLERLVLRGPRPAPGFEGMLEALEAVPESESLAQWLGRIAGAAEPFLAALRQPAVTIEALLQAHVRLAEWLARRPDGQQLWAGEAGEAAAGFVAELALAAGDQEAIAGRDWPALLDVLLAARVVRPRYGTHPRLAIWGLMEARLQQADLIILGGLNEGTWPSEIAADAWLSRPMRGRFGLPPAEQRIGLAAHDFQQAAAAPSVVLTRSEKVEGTPTVASRWLLRLETLLAAHGTDPTRRGAAGILHWLGELDRPARIAAVEAPRPRPPVEARPRRLSVTEVETWIRDPYAIYARHVLKLRPLDPLDADPGAAERGSFIHRALEIFVRSHPEALPPDAEARLVAIGEAVFGDALERPSVRAFWWPRFLRIADWFVAFERERRAAGVRTLAAERLGTFEASGPAGGFLVTGKADRIDRTADGGLVVIDYKTGRPPSDRQVESGLTPQLSLEAAMLQAGGFGDLPQGRLAALAYIRLSGGAPAGEYRALDHDPAQLAAAAAAGLGRLVAAFDDPATPYLSRPRPQFLLRPGLYDHLARVKEWSAAEGEAGT